MKITKSTYSAPASVAGKLTRAESLDELPAEAKAALQNLKEGETVTLTLPGGPRTLTLARRVEMSEEEYERLTAEKQERRLTSNLEAVEQHLKEFEYLDDRVGDAIANLKDDESLDLPVATQRDLEEIEMAMTRVKYSLRDQLQLALLD